MNLSVKNVKFHDDMSQETPCYSASIYLDNKRIGVVRNDGCGGCNCYDWLDYKAGREIERQEPDLDDIIFDLCNQADELKQLKRLCKTQILFQLKSENYEEGQYRSLKPKYKGNPWTPAAKKYLQEKYGDDLGRIINEEIHGNPS
jgi:hypothetical protein